MPCSVLVVLSKLAWAVPIVQPNDVLKVNLYKRIATNSTILLGFGDVNVKRSLHLKQDPPSSNWVLALHQKSTMGTGWIANRQGW